MSEFIKNKSKSSVKAIAVSSASSKLAVTLVFEQLHTYVYRFLMRDSVHTCILSRNLLDIFFSYSILSDAKLSVPPIKGVSLVSMSLTDISNARICSSLGVLLM